MINYMLHYQEVFLNLQSKFLLKNDTLEEKMKILPKMLFIKILCYLKKSDIVNFVYVYKDKYMWIFSLHYLLLYIKSNIIYKEPL